MVIWGIIICACENWFNGEEYLKEGTEEVGETQGHPRFVFELLIDAEADVAVQNQIVGRKQFPSKARTNY